MPPDAGREAAELTLRAEESTGAESGLLIQNHQPLILARGFGAVRCHRHLTLLPSRLIPTVGHVMHRRLKIRLLLLPQHAVNGHVHQSFNDLAISSIDMVSSFLCCEGCQMFLRYISRPRHYHRDLRPQEWIGQESLLRHACH